MLIKSLKILPILVGTANATPILNTPKQANNPTATYELINNQVDNDYEEQNNKIRSYKVWNSTQNPINNTPSETMNSYSYAETNYNEINNVWYYDLTSPAISTNYFVVSYIQVIKITNIIGIQKLNLESKISSLLDTSLQGIETNLKEEIYISSNIEENQDLYNFDLGTTSLFRKYTEIKDRYTIQQLDATEGNYLIETDYYSPATNHLEYNVNQNQNYYIWFIYMLKLNQVRKPDCNWTNTSQFRPLFTPDDSINQNNLSDLYIEETTIATELVQEVVDVPGIMYEVLTMPFAFMSQAFNLTLFPNTPYSVNVSNLLLTIIAILIFVFIIKVLVRYR